MKSLQKWMNLAGVVSAAVALITLAMTLLEIRRDLETARIHEWQEVRVYSLVSSAGIDGLSFQDIQARYNVEVADLPDDLPRDEKKTQALNRILLSLIAKRAVSIRSDGNYGVAFDSTPVQVVRMLDRQFRLQPLGDEIIKMVSDSSGSYSAQELRDLLKGRFQFTDDEFTHVLNDMQRANLIENSSAGKLVSLLRFPSPSIAR